MIKINETKLHEMLGHFYYEVGMLIMTYKLYKNFRTIFKNLSKIEQGITNNMLIETFGIHFGCLYYFFYSQPTYDDVSFKHYEKYINIKIFDSGSTNKEDLKEIKDKRNKQISHLTLKRLNFEIKDKEWDFAWIFKLLKTIKAFTSSFINPREWPEINIITKLIEEFEVEEKQNNFKNIITTFSSTATTSSESYLESIINTKKDI